VVLNLDDKLIRLLAARELNKMPVTEWAILCLEEGLDAPNLRMLASMLPIESPVLFDAKLNQALDELGCLEISSPVLMLTYARLIAQDVLERRVDPIEASRELYLIAQSYDMYAELGAWYEIDEMVSAQTYHHRTGDKDQYFYQEPDILEEFIRKACADFLRSSNNSYSLLANISFDEAESSLQRFLSDNDCPTNIQWIFSEDVISFRKDLLIRTPLHTDNRNRASLYFKYGQDRDLGISVYVLGAVGGKTYCYVVLPESELDAQHGFMGKKYLKFQIRRYALNLRLANAFLWDARRYITRWLTPFAWESSIPSWKAFMQKSASTGTAL
jgi:hypothetical protein